jgi:hypothetical protein
MADKKDLPLMGLPGAQQAFTAGLGGMGGSFGRTGPRTALATIMGFMGVPNLAARQHYGIGMGPGGQPMAPYGQPLGQPQQKPPGTGGDDPPLTDDDKQRQDMIKAGMTPWYVDWLQTNGRYGQWKQPPGLLDG